MSLGGEDIRVVLATDSFLLGDGLTSLLEDVADVSVVGRTNDQSNLASMVDDLRPDAVIYGIRTAVVATLDTVSVARRLRTQYPDIGFVVISDRANGFATELLRVDASRVAYLLDEDLPTMDTVLASLHAVTAGKSVLGPEIVDSLVGRSNGRLIECLTVREHEVLERMASGLSNTAIAMDLNLSLKSVEKGVTGIFLKLGPSNPRSMDRRVSACLEYLRVQSDPFAKFAQSGSLKGGRLQQGKE